MVNPNRQDLGAWNRSRDSEASDRESQQRKARTRVLILNDSLDLRGARRQGTISRVSRVAAPKRTRLVAEFIAEGTSVKLRVRRSKKWSLPRYEVFLAGGQFSSGMIWRVGRKWHSTE